MEDGGIFMNKTYTITVKFKVQAETKRQAENFVFTQLMMSKETSFLKYKLEGE